MPKPRRTAHTLTATRPDGVTHNYDLANGEVKEFKKQLHDTHRHFITFKTLDGQTILLNKHQLFEIELDPIMRS